MKRILNSITTKICPKIILDIRKQFVNFHILSNRYGQFNTVRNWSSVDKAKNEIPWYTYPAIEYLNGIDFHKKSIFEYGSGNSSKYWARASKKITSVEDNENWYEIVSNNILENQSVNLIKDKEKYVDSIADYSDSGFDIVIIDGNHRIECAKQAVLNIKHDGIIILDNSDREEEVIASKYIRSNFNCIQVDFHGFGPINNYTWTTSIFFSRDCTIEPIGDRQPNSPIGSI